MTNKECFESKIPLFDGMEDSEARSPDMPVDKFLQEAENTATWCAKDKDALVKAGLDWALVDDIPVRAGALREAESRWFATRFTREEAQKIWDKVSPEGYALRDEILHAFLFAYRKEPDLLSRAQGIADGSGHADMIQDLNDESVIGKANPDQLLKVTFDMSLLDKAAEISGQLGSLFAAATTDRKDSAKTMITRDKAFAHLKEAIDAIRETGQYVFWRDKERLRGYVSEYNRTHRSKVKEKETVVTP